MNHYCEGNNTMNSKIDKSNKIDGPTWMRLSCKCYIHDDGNKLG